MADQRSAFRFRLPWLPAAPAPRPTIAPRQPSQSTVTATPSLATQQTTESQAPSQPTTTSTPRQTAETQAPIQLNTNTTTPTQITPQAADTQAPFQPTSPTTPTPTTSQAAETQAPIQPTSPTTPTPTTSQAAETEAPTQTTPQTAETQTPSPPTMKTTSTPRNAEMPPFRPPGLAPAQTPQPQASRTESQPSSQSRATTQPQAPSQPASPYRATIRSQVPSQPSTPSRAASSPSRTAPRLSTTAQAAIQPRSPSGLASRPAGQLSSPPSPSSTAAQRQATTEYLTQPTSPSKGEPKLNPESSQPNSNSNKSPSLSNKEEQELKASELQSLELQPKPQRISGMVYDSQNQNPVGTSIEPNKLALQPSEESDMKTFTPTGGPKTPEPKKKSDTSTVSGESQSFQGYSKPEETKEVKEVMQESKNKSIEVDPHRKLDMSKRENIPLHKEIRDDISKLVLKMAIGDAKHSIDDRPVSVITLAGENRGASMHLGSESLKKGGAVHIYRGYKTNPDESAETTTDGEGSIKGKLEDKKAIEDQATEAYVNSNIQGINNSIMFHSTITERNPGVRLIHSHPPTESKKSTTRAEHLDTNKGEFNIAHAQKLTYQPMVRRRCLRGLFLESSDSDPDNKTKPQRHGCRVGCKEKCKENKIDVL